MEASAGISLRAFDGAVVRAYERLFSDDPEKLPDMLNWRFRDNPHGLAKFAIAGDPSDIAGMIALVPTRLRNALGSGMGYQAIDTAVHHSNRGQGLFIKMGALAQDPNRLGGDVLWGFPNANAAPGWYGRLGWTNFGPAPLLMRPLRSTFLLGRVHPKLRSIDFPLVRAKRAASEVYEDGATLSADFDPFWRKVEPSLGIAVDRDGEWMRWRLVDKPSADYRCVGLKSESGELESFVALKVVNKHGGRLCYIMEALSLPHRSAELADMLHAELSRASREGAEVALAWCPRGAPNYRAYRRAGFVPVPARLRPIEINFGARALRPASAAVATCDARWYVSFLDSDTN